MSLNPIRTGEPGATAAGGAITVMPLAAATETSTGSAVTVLPAVSVAESVNDCVEPSSEVVGVQVTVFVVELNVIPVGAEPDGSE